MIEKKEKAVLLICPLLVFLIGILIVSYYPTLNKFKPANINTIKTKLESFKKYQINEDDYEYLKKIADVLKSSNSIIVSVFSILKYLTIFILIISIFQITYIVNLILKIKRQKFPIERK